MNYDDDDFERDHTGKPARIIRDQRRVRVHMLAMDAAPTSLDAHELADQRVVDAAAHRPGWRLGTGRVDPLRAAAADRINAAYTSAWQTDACAWRDRSPAEMLAEAKRTAEESEPSRGASDPDTAKARAYRRKQSARPFEHPEGEDEENNYQVAASACSHCGGSGVEPGGDDDDVDRILEETMAGEERNVRRDVPDSITALRQRHADQMHKAYADADFQTANAWKTPE